MSPDELIDRLGLQPHPEGGWYAETWRDEPADSSRRGAGTAIYFLLRRGERSHWHRVDATEIWHHYAGAPLELELSDGHDHRRVLVGDELLAGQAPQAIVAKGEWQAARTLGDFTLVGCTVSPAFDFGGFELGATWMAAVLIGSSPDWPRSCEQPEAGPA